MGEKADAADEAGEVQGGCKRCIGTQNPAEGIKQQHAEKPRAAQAARYASLRQRFEVIVVGVIDDLAVIEGFVGRENGLERAKTRACPRMIEENAPGVRAHGGALPGGHLERLQRGKSLKDFIRAEPGDQYAQLHRKTDDPAARGGEKQGADGQHTKKPHEKPALPADLTEHQRYQGHGDHQFGKSREVVAVYVRTEGNPAIAHLAEPVELPVERQVLQDAEYGHQESEADDKPDEAAPILDGLEDLGRQEEKNQAG